MYYNLGSGDGIYIILLLAVMGISMYAQSRVQRTFNQFSQTYVTSGLRAEEIAQQLLNRSGSAVQRQRSRPTAATRSASAAAPGRH